MNTAAGAILRAALAGIPDLIPNLRASYEAVVTTLRASGKPHTTMGLPFSDGTSACSTAAK